VEAARPEIARHRAVALRAPRPESRRINGAHLENQGGNVHGEQDETSEKQRADALSVERMRVESEERDEKDQVEMEVRGRQPGPGRARRQVGALDENLAARRRESRDGGPLGRAQDRLRGGGARRAR
jgi:hypothetical protein